MAYHVFRTIVDMMKPKAEIVWDALASVGDAGAHKICVMTQENGKPIDLTGCTAQLLVQRQDEATRYLNADFDASGYACATLDKSCYEVAGRLQCTMQIKGENQSVISVARIYLLVSKAGGDIVIDPTHVVPNLNELLAQYERLKEISDQTEKTILKANTATKNADAAAKRADDAASDVQKKLDNGEFVGAQGPKGEKGDAGPQGPRGEKGDTGERGKQGEKGDKGEPGAKGERGETGAIGATPQITVQVKTGEPGTAASVAQSGTAENPTLEFTIPQGTKGEKGEKGDTGSLGALTINGKAPDEAGKVTLTAADVGARADDWMPTAEDVGALSGTDATLTQAGEAADAKATGDALDRLKTEKANASIVSDAWQTGKTYNAGAYCIYNNALYKALVQTTAEPTNGSDWQKCTIMEEIPPENKLIVHNQTDSTKETLISLIADVIGNKDGLFSIVGSWTQHPSGYSATINSGSYFPNSYRISGTVYAFDGTGFSFVRVNDAGQITAKFYEFTMN